MKNKILTYTCVGLMVTGLASCGKQKSTETKEVENVQKTEQTKVTQQTKERISTTVHISGVTHGPNELISKGLFFAMCQNEPTLDKDRIILVESALFEPTKIQDITQGNLPECYYQNSQATVEGIDTRGSEKQNQKYMEWVLDNVQIQLQDGKRIPVRDLANYKMDSAYFANIPFKIVGDVENIKSTAKYVLTAQANFEQHIEHKIQERTSQGKNVEVIVGSGHLETLTKKNESYTSTNYSDAGTVLYAGLLNKVLENICSE